MKTLGLVLFCVLGTLDLAAMCGNDGLSVFPLKKNIRTNSVFIIEGYSISQRIVRNLDKKNPAYLKSGNQKIRLKVLEVIEGQFHLTQAVLRPEHDLTPGREYSLFIDSLEEYPAFTRWNSQLQKSERVTYIAMNDADTLKPFVSRAPKFIKEEYTPYGCGPAVYAIFKCAVKDSSEYLVKALVKDIKTGKTGMYYLAVEKGMVNIGHGMCSGEFAFDKGRTYEVQFSVMDASGNLVECGGPPIRFKSPAR